MVIRFTMHKKAIIIHTNRPWYDTHANIIDAHEPHLSIFDGRLYLYGTGYANQSK